MAFRIVRAVPSPAVPRTSWLRCALGAVTYTDDARLLDQAMPAGTPVRGWATLFGWACAIEHATLDGDA